MNTDLIKFLSQFTTDNRVKLFDKVILDRTRYITIALEDIYQSQNASAVLRTADCFGIQDVHIIENQNEYQLNPDVALGSSNWLNLHKYNKSENNTLESINNLKAKGYRIVATTPHTNDVNLEDFNLENGKVALFFGTEVKGLSNIVIENADEYLKIPMYGFTESFNISVSVAIILHHLTNELRKIDVDWHLSNSEKNEIKLAWLKQSIRMSSELVDKFLSMQNKS